MSRIRLMALVAALALCSGCAVFNRDNTPALNFVEDRLLPEKGAARYVAYPVLLPVALTAVVLDAVIIHPVSVADDAVLDTRDALWKNFDWNRRYVSECTLLIPRALLTPVVFPVCFLGRSTLDLEPRGGSPRIRERAGPSAKTPPQREENRAEELVAQAGKALGEGRYDDAIALADKAEAAGRGWRDSARAIKAAALLEQGNVDAFCALTDKPSPWLVADDLVVQHMAHALRTGSTVEQMKLLARLGRGYWSSLPPGPETVAALEGLLGAQDRAVAMQALVVLGRFESTPSIRAVLERVAHGKDTVLAACAQAYLAQPAR